jgi:hypothetical protein
MTALHLLLGDSCSLFLGPAAASSYQQLLPACLEAALSVQRFEQGLKRQLVPVADVLNSSGTFNSAGEMLLNAAQLMCVLLRSMYSLLGQHSNPLENMQCL